MLAKQMLQKESRLELYERTMIHLEKVLNVLTDSVPPPKIHKIEGGGLFRYEEQNVKQAVVQKLARLLSALRAAEALLEAGFVQELGVLHRVVDEANEDVAFLVLSSREDELPKLTKEFLDSFYGEEIIGGKITGLPDIGKAEVSRRKIRAFIAEKAGVGSKKSSMIDNGKKLSKAFSGYVHGASHVIMELYGGDPPKFHVRGLRGTSIQAGFQKSMFNYYYRTLISFVMALELFGLTPDDELKALVAEFDKIAQT